MKYRLKKVNHQGTVHMAGQLEVGHTGIMFRTRDDEIRRVLTEIRDRGYVEGHKCIERNGVRARVIRRIRPGDRGFLEALLSRLMYAGVVDMEEVA